MNLSPDELVALTGKSKPSAQARELEHLGIPHKPRRDGSLVVLRVHVETGQTHELSGDRRPEPRLRFDG